MAGAAGPVSDAGTILVVTPDDARRARARSALGGVGHVTAAGDLGSALDEISLGETRLALVDVAIPDDGVRDVMVALGGPGRAIIWSPSPRTDLIEYGAYLQLPYDVSDEGLTETVRWLLSLHQARREAERGGGVARELDRALSLVTEIRHELNNPLTALMAEVQLLLMDADQFGEDQRQSLRTVEQMAQRMRDLVRRLQELKRR